jgi:hypothetical protein
MGRAALILSAWCATFVATVAGQTVPPPTGTAPRAREAPQPLSLTGCVKTWDPTTMGPPPPAARGTVEPAPAGPSAPFVLIDSERKAAPAPPSQPDRPPLSDERPTSGAHATYLLKPASPAVNLAAHVDRQVEITGTLVADPAAATPAARENSTPSSPEPPVKAPPRPGEDAAEPVSPVVLTVTAIRTIQKACVVK